MLVSDRRRVAKPGANNVTWVDFFKFRLSGAAQAIEGAPPWFQVCPADDPVQLRPQVRLRGPIAGDDMFRAGFSQRKRFVATIAFFPLCGNCVG